MENQPTNIKKINHAELWIILGFSSILVALSQLCIWRHLQASLVLIASHYSDSTVVIVLGIKKIKESNDGLSHVGEAIKAGLGISLISALIYVPIY